MLKPMELAVSLRENGYKVTPQRLAVYEVLTKDKSHPSAEVIYKKLRPMYPSMSFATVYKTVEILNKINVIQILNTCEESNRYDAVVTKHYHIQCTKCGKVENVQATESPEVKENVSKDTGYDISGEQVYFYGTCPKCQKLKA